MIILQLFLLLEDTNFHCISDSSNKTLQFPNISNVHFNAYAILNFKNLTMRTTQTSTPFYILPPQTLFGRNCSGDVYSIRYCYQIPLSEWISIREQNVTVFELLLGMQRWSSFYIEKRLNVNSTPSNQICSSKGMIMVCCDVYNSSSYPIFQITQSKFVYGIFMHYSLLSFKNNFKVSRYMGNLTESAGVYKLSPRTAGIFLLLQFSIGKNIFFFFFFKCIFVTVNSMNASKHYS